MANLTKHSKLVIGVTGQFALRVCAHKTDPDKLILKTNEVVEASEFLHDCDVPVTAAWQGSNYTILEVNKVRFLSSVAEGMAATLAKIAQAPEALPELPEGVFLLVDPKVLATPQ